MKRAAGSKTIFKPLIYLMLLAVSVLPAAGEPRINPDFAADVSALRRAFADVEFSPQWDQAAEDWVLLISSSSGRYRLFYAEGRYLSSEQLENREHYRRVFYSYSTELIDPSTYTTERTDRMREYGTAENRMASPVTSPALFDALYGSESRESVERRLVSVNFFGWQLDVHERIAAPLASVETRVLSLAEDDEAVAEFVETIGHLSSYNWRQVRDTTGKSFHSIGIAVDLMPENWRNRKIYWVWEREGGNPDWMILPLEERWMPPAAVIKIFEDEGFIWGGHWFIWDNMHFEYRPELLLKLGS